MNILEYPFNLTKKIVKRGIEITIRPITPQDDELEVEFVNNLSEHSKYMRFMSTLKELSPDMVFYFTNINYNEDMAFVATVIDKDKERQIAVGRYHKLKDKSICEFAIVIGDNWKGTGLGRIIMEMLISDAKNKGHKKIEGEVLAINTEMIKFVQRLGFKIVPDPESAQQVYAVLEL